MNSSAKIVDRLRNANQERERCRQIIYVIVHGILVEKDPEYMGGNYKEQADMIANQLSWWGDYKGFTASAINNVVSLTMHYRFYSMAVRVNYKRHRELSKLIYERLKAWNHDYKLGRKTP
jgi:hypothetical protein